MAVGSRLIERRFVWLGRWPSTRCKHRRPPRRVAAGWNLLL